MYQLLEVRSISKNTIKSMVEWINKNITDNPTLEAMSDFVGYSPFYCSSKFHEHMGITYKQYIANKRLIIALDMLRTTKLRIIDIALYCCFSSQEAFSRAFIKKYKCSPTEYRKKLYKNKIGEA